MKERIIFLLLCISICLQLCSCNKETVIWDTDNESAEQNITQQEDAETVEAGQETYLEEEPPQQNTEQEESEQEQIVYEAPLPLGEYRIVQPTQAELDEAVYRFDNIISTFHKDYDSSVDNIYEYLFFHDHFNYVCPEYEEEVIKYVAVPLDRYNSGRPSWKTTINENDPLGKFNKIPDGIYDGDGKVDDAFVYAFIKEHDWREAITGHNKFSGVYMDWLVEGVWNGKVDHETFFEFEDGTQLYYYDGHYYTHEHDIGGRGGGVFHGTMNEIIEPMDDGKYKLTYNVMNDINEPYGKATAVIALKEAENGFRFWSIYSIDYEKFERLGEYRIAQPTQAELDEILPRLDLVFSTFHDDYDSSSDNIYEYLFHRDYLSEFVYPQYKEEAKQYVAPPMSYYEGDTSKPRWYKSVKAEDPRGKYPKLVEEILDENGKVDYELVNAYLESHSFLDTITGHTKYSGEYIDWLVEGVWNGKPDHETFFTFDDGSRCYYYDGCYILPEHDLGGRGSSGPYSITIDSLTPVEDGKYKLEYTVMVEMEEVCGKATAVIALKEAENGFRFWSIYSIDYQSID